MAETRPASFNRRQATDCHRRHRGLWAHAAHVGIAFVAERLACELLPPCFGQVNRSARCRHACRQDVAGSVLWRVAATAPTASAQLAHKVAIFITLCRLLSTMAATLEEQLQRVHWMQLLLVSRHQPTCGTAPACAPGAAARACACRLLLRPPHAPHAPCPAVASSPGSWRRPRPVCHH